MLDTTRHTSQVAVPFYCLYHLSAEIDDEEDTSVQVCHPQPRRRACFRCRAVPEDRYTSSIHCAGILNQIARRQISFHIHSFGDTNQDDLRSWQGNAVPAFRRCAVSRTLHLSPDTTHNIRPLYHTTMTPLSLHAQRLPPAPPPTKIRLALLATALSDALGGPAEFHPRFSFDFVSHMQPNDNFGLPAGVWTDDTSMTLALARSIATFEGDAEGDAQTKGKGKEKGKERRGGMDAADQLDAYYRWWQSGTLSATGRCFDIGNTIQRALSLYRDALRAAGVADPATGVRARVGAVLSLPSSKAEKREKTREAAHVALSRIARDLKGAVFGGNGSLMRVVPVGLAFWNEEEERVGEWAAESSRTTHPNAVCGEACKVWARCVARVVRSAAGKSEEGMENEKAMTKLDVLHHFAAFPYTTDALRKALAADVPLPASAVGDPATMEAHYTSHHRLLRLISQTLQASTAAAAAVEDSDADALAEAHTLALLPQAAALPSSGYVVDTLAAALYAFLATRTFEAGALLTANMGNDADTVAAVYGGLAGAWYGVEDPPAAAKKDSGSEGEVEGLFWSPRVREWRDALVRRDMIEEVTEELVKFAERSTA
ncbi:ADP-ribosylation/Crystallin J1 [Mycena capillaripes]|nr:ADP-ribosylation/Crystallin J1 [Mycena capillaripes]